MCVLFTFNSHSARSIRYCTALCGSLPFYISSLFSTHKSQKQNFAPVNMGVSSQVLQLLQEIQHWTDKLYIWLSGMTNLPNNVWLYFWTWTEEDIIILKVSICTLELELDIINKLRHRKDVWPWLTSKGWRWWARRWENVSVHRWNGSSLIQAGFHWRRARFPWRQSTWEVKHFESSFVLNVWGRLQVYELIKVNVLVLQSESPDTSHCLFISLFSSSTESGIPEGRLIFGNHFLKGWCKALSV